MAGVAVVVGAGDMGMRLAEGLLAQGRLDGLTLAGVGVSRLRDRVAMLDAAWPCRVDAVDLDGRDSAAAARLLRAVRPDLVVQCASLFGPWAVIGSAHPVIRHLSAAGIGVQLPNQLPALTGVMRAARDVGLDCPVANLSAPDATHPVLAAQGLAPTVGLGNVSMQLLRARSAWRARREAAGEDVGDPPLVRAIGHHHQVYGAMRASFPDDPGEAVRIHLGEDGARDDRLAYEGHSFAPGPIYNVMTAASALPVLSALLPDGDDIRFSAPAPFGLPGGYPLRLGPGGAIALDLPPGVTRDEAVAFNAAMGRLDGVEAVEADGTVRFTEAARRHVARVDPRLAEPLAPADVDARAELLVEIVSAATG